MDEMMKLVIGWTIVVAFVFTTGLTCLSLVFKNIFQDKKQQQGLYVALILELVIGTAAKVSDSASFDPERTGRIVKSEGAAEVVEAAVNDALRADAADAPDKQALEKMIGRLSVVSGTRVADWKEDLEKEVKRLPDGRVRREDAERLRRTRMLSTPLMPR